MGWHDGEGISGPRTRQKGVDHFIFRFARIGQEVLINVSHNQYPTRAVIKNQTLYSHWFFLDMPNKVLGLQSTESIAIQINHANWNIGRLARGLLGKNKTG
ncbi:MAG: hypothetical protein WA672_18535 [Candidatus Angelobacter sp.]